VATAHALDRPSGDGEERLGRHARCDLPGPESFVESGLLCKQRANNARRVVAVYMVTHSSRSVCNRVLALLPALFAASTAIAAAGLNAGGLSEFKVELTSELRELAGRGKPSPVTHALVTFAVPANFDAARDWPVMVISATSEPGNPNRGLLREYAAAALASGWILVAADPAEKIPPEQDEVLVRFVLNFAALAALASQWPGAGKAPLAFGGFSGGAKYSGWLAAAFRDQGRTVMGIYVAGINLNTVLSAARDFNVLNEAYKRIPVFLQSGEEDEIATPADHRRIQAELEGAGFKHVRIEYFRGPHVENAALLRTALDWFRELAARPPAAK
jgi:predicted esterase